MTEREMKRNIEILNTESPGYLKAVVLQEDPESVLIMVGDGYGEIQGTCLTREGKEKLIAFLNSTL